MFDINRAVKKLEQLEHDKTHGLPYKPKSVNPKVEHIDGDILNNEATQEGIAISKAFRNRTTDFGKRLNKSSGQDHKRKGHYKMGKAV